MCVVMRCAQMRQHTYRRNLLYTASCGLRPHHTDGHNVCMIGYDIVEVADCRLHMDGDVTDESIQVSRALSPRASLARGRKTP